VSDVVTHCFKTSNTWLYL